MLLRDLVRPVFEMAVFGIVDVQLLPILKADGVHYDVAVYVGPVGMRGDYAFMAGKTPRRHFFGHLVGLLRGHTVRRVA